MPQITYLIGNKNEFQYFYEVIVVDNTSPKTKNQNIGLSFLRNLLCSFVVCILFPIVNVIWALIEGLIFLIFRAVLTLLLMSVFVISFLFIANSVFLAGIPLFLASCFLYYMFFEIEFFENVKSCQMDEKKVIEFELKKFQYTIHGCFIYKSYLCLRFLYEFLYGNVPKLKNKINSIGIDKSRNYEEQLPMFIKVLGFIFGNLSLLIFGVIHFSVGLIICISRATWRPLLYIFGVLVAIQAGSVLAVVALSFAVFVLFLSGLSVDKTSENRYFVSDFLEILEIKDFFMETFKKFQNNTYSCCKRMFHEMPKNNKNESKDISITTTEFSKQGLNLSGIIGDNDKNENDPQGILSSKQINQNEKN